MALKLRCFNPLNQVYVFNAFNEIKVQRRQQSFNPLNQVYVFNRISFNGLSLSATSLF